MFLCYLSCMPNQSINSCLFSCTCAHSCLITLCNPHVLCSFLFLFGTEMLCHSVSHPPICFHCLSVVAVTLHCLALQLNQAGAIEHRITYITLLSPSRSVSGTSHSLSRSLTPLHTHSLSPPSFSLTVSPIALRTESSTADAFSPTCPYLQKKARRETFPPCTSFLLWI